jgi:hypothetical protein
MTVALATVIIDVAGEIAPGVTVTVGEAVLILLPPMVAEMEVAVPATTPVNNEV